MNESESGSKLKFPVRRDGSSAFLYYFSFFFVLLAVCRCWIALVPVGIPASWTAVVCTLCVFGLGIAYLCARTKRRFSEGYVFDTEELVFDDGIHRIRVPYSNLTTVHPTDHHLKGIPGKELCLYWKSPGGSSRDAIASPHHQEAFLEQLAARCPQLERSESCLFPRT